MLDCNVGFLQRFFRHHFTGNSASQESEKRKKTLKEVQFASKTLHIPYANSRSSHFIFHQFIISWLYQRFQRKMHCFQIQCLGKHWAIQCVAAEENALSSCSQGRRGPLLRTYDKLKANSFLNVEPIEVDLLWLILFIFLQKISIMKNIKSN